MFGFSLRCQLFQGPAVRTWNCVSNFANLLWYKFYHVGKQQIMPRSRRRHHSRSRSRSRSSSLDRPRDVKRRKIDSYDSHKHSLSSDNEAKSPRDQQTEQNEAVDIASSPEKNNVTSEQQRDADNNDDKSVSMSAQSSSSHDCDLGTEAAPSSTLEVSSGPSTSALQPSATDAIEKTTVTPKKRLAPRQLQKRVESEKRRQEREMERKARKDKLEEEKRKLRDEKEQKRIKEKMEKQEQKQKELDEKQKEKELKDEKKKKEREEKDQKRKEKEEKREEKRREQEEKDKEKQKKEEKKQKVSAAFVNFFTKKSDSSMCELGVPSNSNQCSSLFMPFEVKADMRLAPMVRRKLTEEEQNHFINAIDTQNCEVTYLKELKSGKLTEKHGKTWIYTDDDIIIIDSNPGESIDEQALTLNKMKAKFLLFEENRRPAYYGTWSKNSKMIKARTPFKKDEEFLDYEIDSDEDWEEEDPNGESLRGSDDEEKDDNETETYEEDNEFFVPHGHLSEDELNDEENAVMNPEDQKARLKLLKKAFDDERKEKTQKIKPRVIGCIWYNSDQSNIEKAIDEFLKPYAIISNGPIVIKKRSDIFGKVNLNIPKPLSQNLIPDFLKFIHGKRSKRIHLAKEFINHLKENNIDSDTSRASLGKQLKKFATWMKCQEEGPMFNKFCWMVNDEIKEQFKVNLTLN